VKTISTNLLSPLFAIGILAGLVSCQSKETQSTPDASVEQNSSKVTAEQNSREVAMNVNQQLSFSKQDLADRLGIDADAIKIKLARQITWRSGALGCPKPGMNYTQALVPGVLILLDADGETYGYHAQKNQKPFYCPSRQAVIPDSIQKEDLA
jgi:hypothetical protein